MFPSNPFEPIEDVVAEAKQERAQLDGLLTLSTPRERALLALTSVLVILFGAWLFFGDVTRNLMVKGVLVAFDEQELVSRTSLKVVVWLPAGAAREIRADMPATIELEVGPGTGQSHSRQLIGKIAAVAHLPLPNQLAPLDPNAPVTVLELKIALEHSPEFETAHALECRVIVDLGEQAPAALFGLRQS